MRVAVTGGTGYVGPAIVSEFLKAGHEVNVLEHRRPLDLPDAPHLRRMEGDVLDPESLRRAFEGVDAVVHLVAILHEKPQKGITFERMHVDATRNVLEAAKEVGVRRILHMSANGVDDDSVDTAYFRTKREAEQLVRESGLEWTIFRPSYVAGSKEGGFDAQFADIVDKAPLLPSFAGGKFEIQPISRRNVAEAFARALETPEAVGEAYTLVGPERFTWNEYLRRLADVRGRKRMLAHVPRWFILSAATVAGPVFPASPDQLRMLMAGNAGDPSHAVHDLHLQLEPWEEAVSGLRRP